MYADYMKNIDLAVTEEELKNTKERRKMNKELKNNIIKLRKPIKNLIKLTLLIVMLVLTYQVSNAFVDYISTIDTIILKRILNIILVVIIIIYSMNKRNNLKEG